MFHVHLKRMCILLLWDERMLYIYFFGMKGYIYILLSPFDLWHCSMLQYLCCYFVWKVYPFLTVGVLKSPSISVLLSISFLKSSKIFLIYLGAPMLGECICVYNVYVFLMDSSLEYYEVTFWVSFYGSFF